jgi:hypothetical protein
MIERRVCLVENHTGCLNLQKLGWKIQEEHHEKVCWKNEYIELLDQFEIDYEDRYLLLNPV